MNLVVSGPGGVGKGTVIRHLVARDPTLYLSRSWTTRARRAGEDEDAYTFVDKETFLQKVSEGGFLEWATVLDEYYGTPLPSSPHGQDLVLEIDVQGARQVLEKVPDVYCVLMLAPSREVQLERLRVRGDDETRIAERLVLGEHEVEQAKLIADAILVNDDLDQAVDELAGIVAQARAKFRREHR